MKKVDDAAANGNAKGPGWFKIMEDGYDESSKLWCTEKLIQNDGHMAAQIPKDLAPGYYLMRPELLALHQADKTPPDPQFYVGCAQIFLSSTGTVQPKNTVSIPGYVDMNTPAMTYNVWSVPLKLPFPDPGPPMYTDPKSTRDLSQRDINVQTIGLKPADCVMQNGNWCGFMPPTYNDASTCYSVSIKCSNILFICCFKTLIMLQSSANCSTQTQSCYNSAGPTGGKNCHNWEDYCTQIRNGCGSGGVTGPPPIKALLPAPPQNLQDQNKVVMADAATPSAASFSNVATASPPTTLVTSASPTSVAVPTGAVTAGAIPGADNVGSIDTCGSNGGQKCATGLCCSAHGSVIPYILRIKRCLLT